MLNERHERQKLRPIELNRQVRRFKCKWMVCASCYRLLLTISVGVIAHVTPGGGGWNIRPMFSFLLLKLSSPTTISHIVTVIHLLSSNCPQALRPWALFEIYLQYSYIPRYLQQQLSPLFLPLFPLNVAGHFSQAKEGTCHKIANNTCSKLAIYYRLFYKPVWLPA